MKPSNTEDIRFAGRANNQFGLDAAGIGIMATSPLGSASDAISTANAHQLPTPFMSLPW